MNDKILQLLKMQGDLIKELTADEDLHTKTPAQWGTNTPLHGPGGIFAVNGLEREIVTAHMRPYGIGSKLNLYPSVYVDPRFGALTGFTDVNGSQPDHACDDAPSGYMKACTLTARFGRVRFDTPTIDMNDVMLKLHRGDFTDLRLYGSLLGLEGLGPSMSETDVLNVVTKAEMVGTAVQTERELSRQLWQGTYGVNNEFPGIDVQVATGQVDAETGVACPALDSDVKDFAYDDVCGSGRSIVEYLSMLEQYLYHNATNMGLMPVNWIIAMREQLWQELTACWPCQYNTNKCSPAVAANGSVVLDGRDNTRERDAMRNGMYIDINGRRYPVVTDTGIFEHNNINNGNLRAAEYASSIYMLPTTIRGGLPVLYREYVDYKQAQPDVSLLSNMQQFFWSDNGLFSWAYEGVKWCYKLSLKTEQRVVLRTPHLAGRIDHVRYSPLQHLREPEPDSPYFADGGVSLRDALGAPLAVWGTRVQ